MIKLMFILLFEFSYCALYAQQKEWTLVDCVEFALSNNINLKKQKNALKLSALNFNKSKIDILPTLNANISQNFNFGKNASPEDNQYIDLNTKSSNFSISLSIPLTEQISNYKTLKIKKIDFQASLLELEQAKEDISLNVTSAFLQILYQHELMCISRRQCELSNEFYNKVVKKRGLNVVSKIDVSNAKVEALQDQYNLVQTKNEFDQALSNLKQLINLPANEDFKIKFSDSVSFDKEIIPELNDIYCLAVNKNSGIKAAQYRLHSQVNSISLTKMLLVPNLSLQLGVNTGYYVLDGVSTNTFRRQWNNNMNKSIMLNLSVPLFNHFEIFSRIKEAKIQLSEQKITLEGIKQDLYRNIQETYLKIIDSLKKMEVSEYVVIASSEYYNQIHDKYLIGKATMYELNEAKTKALKAKIENLQTKYEYVFNLKILKYYTQ